MRLEEIMTRVVDTIGASRPASEAWSRMQSSRIHHLVVMERGVVEGIISARDLGGRSGAALRDGKRVADLMTPDILAGDPRMTVRRAANLLRGRSIGCLPVLNDRRRLVGIVTLTDLLTLLGRGIAHPTSDSKRSRRQRIRGPRDFVRARKAGRTR